MCKGSVAQKAGWVGRIGKKLCVVAGKGKMSLEKKQPRGLTTYIFCAMVETLCLSLRAIQYYACMDVCVCVCILNVFSVCDLTFHLCWSLLK